jgi:hypothetical protein
MLITASAASMAGNIAHAWEHRDTVTAAGAVAAAAIPPLALLSLTHLAGMWSRISARGIVYWCFLAAVAAIATAAFRLSFDALRSLAVRYGYGHTDAALFPLILDGLVAVCTLGLVVLSRIEAPVVREAAGDAHRDAGGAAGVQRGAGDADRDAASAPREANRGAFGDAAHDAGVNRDSAGDSSGDAAGATLGTVLTSAAPPAIGAAPLTSADSPTASSDAWWRTAAAHRDAEPLSRRTAVHARDAAGAHRETRPDADDAHLHLAHHLVDAGRTTVDLDAVHAVLSRTAGGESNRSIAAELGLSASAVQRIVKAARDEQESAART